MSCFEHNPNRIPLEILKNDHHLVVKFLLKISPYFFSDFRIPSLRGMLVRFDVNYDDKKVLDGEGRIEGG